MPSLHPTLLSRASPHACDPPNAGGSITFCEHQVMFGSLRECGSAVFRFHRDVEVGWSCLSTSLKCWTAHFLIGSRARAHGARGSLWARGMLLRDSGSLQVFVVVPIKMECAAGPKTLNVAASPCDWACVLGAADVQRLARFAVAQGCRHRGGICATG
jgi:hypothetical protein